MKHIYLVFAIVLAAASSLAAQAPKPIAPAELEKLLSAPESKVLLVDVRTAEEYQAGHISGAVLFPYDEIDGRKADFRKLAVSADRKIVVYCRSGRRSAIAAQTLVGLGYTDVANFGAVTNWKGKLER
jgi:phage shock protein E